MWTDTQVCKQLLVADAHGSWIKNRRAVIFFFSPLNGLGYTARSSDEINPSAALVNFSTLEFKDPRGQVQEHDGVKPTQGPGGFHSCHA